MRLRVGLDGLPPHNNRAGPGLQPDFGVCARRGGTQNYQAQPTKEGRFRIVSTISDTHEATQTAIHTVRSGKGRPSCWSTWLVCTHSSRISVSLFGHFNIQAT